MSTLSGTTRPHDEAKHPRGQGGQWTQKAHGVPGAGAALTVSSPPTDTADTAPVRFDGEWTGRPFTVQVQPQAWVNDYAVNTGPSVDFDIAPLLAEMPRARRAEVIRAIEERDYSLCDLDDLYLDAADRGLVESGFGPFDVSADMEPEDMEAWHHDNPASDDLLAPPNPLLPDHATTKAEMDALAEALGKVEYGDYKTRDYLASRLRGVALVHAGTVRGAADVRALAGKGVLHNDSDAETWVRYGKQRAALAAAHASSGLGDNATRISVAEARRSLPTGSRIEVAFLGRPPGQDDQRTVTKQTDHEMVSTRPDGTAVHTTWAKTLAYRDQHDNLIVCDENGHPFVAYRKSTDQ